MGVVGGEVVVVVVGDEEGLAIACLLVEHQALVPCVMSLPDFERDVFHMEEAVWVLGGFWTCTLYCRRRRRSWRL